MDNNKGSKQVQDANVQVQNKEQERNSKFFKTLNSKLGYIQRTSHFRNIEI